MQTSPVKHIYKFVSSKKIKEGDLEHNMTNLDEDTLCVANLEGNSPASQVTSDGKLPEDGEFDGTGRWLPTDELVMVNVQHPGETNAVPRPAVAQVFRTDGQKIGMEKA